MYYACRSDYKFPREDRKFPDAVYTVRSNQVYESIEARKLRDSKARVNTAGGGAAEYRWQIKCVLAGDSPCFFSDVGMCNETNASLGWGTTVLTTTRPGTAARPATAAPKQAVAKEITTEKSRATMSTIKSSPCL